MTLFAVRVRHGVRDGLVWEPEDPHAVEFACWVQNPNGTPALYENHAAAQAKANEMNGLYSTQDYSYEVNVLTTSSATAPPSPFTREHEQDIETISARFIEEADARGWCSEYDEIISELNSKLHCPLRPRPRPSTFSVIANIECTATDAQREALAELIRDAIDHVMGESIVKTAEVPIHDWTVR